VSATAYRFARLSEIEPLPGPGGIEWLPVRHALDVRAFGVNAWRATEAGQEVVEPHDETGAGAGRHEELYIVVAGRARFAIEGDEIDAPAGTLVFVPDPTSSRRAVAEEAGTTVLVVGAAAGDAFRVSPWEFAGRAIARHRAGDPVAAAALVREGLEVHPGNPALLYDLACFETLAGERDAALEHLAVAVAADEELRDLARRDEDLDPIRDDPRFPAG
jgi:hypothetical protein